MTITNGYCTLADFKLTVNIPSGTTTFDSRSEAVIQASSRAIDAWCGDSFYAQSSSARVYRATTPTRVVTHAFTALSSVYTDDGNNGTYNQVWTSTTDVIPVMFNAVSDYDGLTRPYRGVEAVGGRWFPCSGNRPRVQVTATWGWSAVPDAVREACLLKAARLFRRKDMPDAEAGGFNLGIIRVTTREDPDVVALLAPFRRLEGTVLR